VSGRRREARRLLVQALYQHQVGGHSAAELQAQFAGAPEFPRADQGFFRDALDAILGNLAALDAGIGRVADRPVEQLDPVERSILWLGLHELSGDGAPAGVVINEAVELAKEFGAATSHRYINALLDAAASQRRSGRREA
jgi:N utilization substance protein B